MAARDELVAAVADRYARGDRGERGRILDEFAAVGYHRKHGSRPLTWYQPVRTSSSLRLNIVISRGRDSQIN